MGVAKEEQEEEDSEREEDRRDAEEQEAQSTSFTLTTVRIEEVYIRVITAPLPAQIDGCLAARYQHSNSNSADLPACTLARQQHWKSTASGSSPCRRCHASFRQLRRTICFAVSRETPSISFRSGFLKP